MNPLLAKIAQLKAAQAAQLKETSPIPATTSTTSPSAAAPTTGITWNPEQLQAIQYGASLKGFVLIGAAGTGKTTTIKEVIKKSLENFSYKIEVQTKNLKVGAPAIALVSFTNRAVKNIRKAVVDIPAIYPNCLTIHKLLEFKPEDISILSDNGEELTSRRFIPTYDAYNPISSLRLVIVDEASMVDTRLFKMLKDACPNATFIFIGDLNQLPPVFGDAILGFKLTELPVVELTRVYRQAMESPIVGFQHLHTLQGKGIGETLITKYNEGIHGKGIEFKPVKMKLADPENMSSAFADYIRREKKELRYNWQEDIILIPYNKAFGTVFVNREIAQWMGEERQADVYEILAGRAIKYFAVGDLVMHQKNEYVIEEIKRNPKYVSRPPKQHSQHLRRDGTYRLGHKPPNVFDESFMTDAADAFDNLLASQIEELEAGESDSAKRGASSHIIVLKPLASLDEEESTTTEVATLGEVGNLDFGYAITVHKSQGSEWRKVYFVMTNHHAPMLNRELLYTGMTRAKEHLTLVYSPETTRSAGDHSINKAIKMQKVKGKSWKDKVEMFKGKYDQYQAIMRGED